MKKIQGFDEKVEVENGWETKGEVVVGEKWISLFIKGWIFPPVVVVVDAPIKPPKWWL